MEWMPIDTAPKDGKEIQVYSKVTTEQFVAYWKDGNWCIMEIKNGPIINVGEITHWMDLPPPPKA